MACGSLVAGTAAAGMDVCAGYLEGKAANTEEATSNSSSSSISSRVYSAMPAAGAVFADLSREVLRGKVPGWNTLTASIGQNIGMFQPPRPINYELLKDAQGKPAFITYQSQLYTG
jgi:hypothetical protein